MEKVQISEFEYNYLRNQLLVCERALQTILEQSGRLKATFGNVAVYTAMDCGVGAFFVDEDGERLDDLDYAHMDNLLKA